MIPIDSTIILLLKVVFSFSYSIHNSAVKVNSVLMSMEMTGQTSFRFSLTHSNFIIIILIHFLVLIRIYDTIALFISIVILIYFIIYFRRKKILLSKEGAS